MRDDFTLAARPEESRPLGDRDREASVLHSNLLRNTPDDLNEQN
jgi:hypothetical protein